MRTTLLWLMYILGQIIAIYFRASASALSPLTAWTTVRGFVTAHFKQVAYNSFGATVLFVLWWRHPGLIPGIVGSLGVAWATALATALVSAFPITIPTSLVYGFFSDKLVDWLFLKFGWTSNAPAPAPTPNQP